MTKEDIMRMAEASGVEDSLLYEHWRCNLESMTRFADLVAFAEREACAKLCEDASEPDGADLAQRIRAKGQA